MLRLRLHAIGLGLALAVFVSACAGTYAGEGAKTGAAGGAVAGALGGLFFGGNVLGTAAAGAAAGAAGGAVVGGMTRKDSDSPPPEPAPQAPAGQESPSPPEAVPAPPAGESEARERDRALEDRFGSENFEAAQLLAQCEHDRAISEARRAYQDGDTDERRAYALMLEAVAAEEVGDTATAAAVYPRFVELAPAYGPVDRARSEALSEVLKVQQARRDSGLPPTCT
jgi:osmotically inducible lipoprotein OsmB